MKIAIIGTRGIPNNYGGFEQFAEYLSLGLVDKGVDVYVYNSHNHPYQNKSWRGVNIIHQYDPEFKIGTAGQFIYDLNCIINSHKHNFDIILQLGYTSSSVFSMFFPKKSIVITNMDGLEWKRTKYNKMTQNFLLFAEKLAVKKSNLLVSDSIGIQNYITNTYSNKSVYIPYGASVFKNENIQVLEKFNIKPYSYNVIIARLEPENSIEIILDGSAESDIKSKILVIANNNTTYGTYLKNKYVQHNHIVFLGSIYDIEILNNIRFFSSLYFHGHTVGGTNPSLLEAMASSALIVAQNNEFNKSILGDDAFYFESKQDVSQVINSIIRRDSKDIKVFNNIDKINDFYNWPTIINSYYKLFQESLL